MFDSPPNTGIRSARTLWPFPCRRYKNRAHGITTIGRISVSTDTSPDGDSMVLAGLEVLEPCTDDKKKHDGRLASSASSLSTDVEGASNAGYPSLVTVPALNTARGDGHGRTPFAPALLHQNPPSRQASIHLEKSGVIVRHEVIVKSDK